MPHFYSIIASLSVEPRQRSRKAETNRTYICIRFGAEHVFTAAEKLRLSIELNMYLKAYN